jgi:Putative ATPase subunit of terminase (gpP-like)
MLTWEEDVQAHALRRQGWTISAIARHLGRDRKTIRAYLRGERTAGVRIRRAPDPFEPFADYCRLRLEADPHLWATTLFDEVGELGYRAPTRRSPGAQGSPAAAALRALPGVGRPRSCGHRAPAGAGDPVGLAGAARPTRRLGLGRHRVPAGGGAGLLGPLARGACRGHRPGHLVDGLDRVARRLGGLTRRWRFDRMATVCSPATGRLQASFAGVAKHYGVGVDLCPARQGNRKGVVEKANHAAAQRWWRTLGDDCSIAEAQANLDRLCAPGRAPPHP